MKEHVKPFVIESNGKPIAKLLAVSKWHALSIAKGKFSHLSDIKVK